MKEIKAEEYPALVSAVERYVGAVESPDADVICAILGIEAKKKVDFMDISVISNLGFNTHVQHFMKAGEV